jgi:hypothetical protein
MIRLSQADHTLPKVSLGDRGMGKAAYTTKVNLSYL